MKAVLRSALATALLAAGASLPACINVSPPAGERTIDSSPNPAAAAASDAAAVGGVVIAHRGASGDLPEHTLAAYALAFGQGADVLEPDLVMTRDGALLCAHDLTAEGVSDVASVFPGRQRGDGKWYFADLTLEEVRRLTVLGRGEARRAEAAGLGLRFATFDEFLRLVRVLNARTGRTVGIVPEIKSPDVHRAQGLEIEKAVVAALRAAGYRQAGAEAGGATIQSFDLEALGRVRRDFGWQGPLVWNFRELPAAADLVEAAALVQGFGPSRTVIEPGPDDPKPALDLVAFARARGLKVYPWTFGDDFAAARRFFEVHRVDGLFIDDPDVGVRARDSAALR